MSERNFFRREIAAMSGYTPGEQPKIPDLVKLNTNENPYPPSAEIAKLLQTFPAEKLRRYPDPVASKLRSLIAAHWGAKSENIICGNGSDDILTMIFRAFTAPDLPMAMLFPSYSLYRELAAMQGAQVVEIPLTDGDFLLPGDLLERAEKANLLMLTRPNAPTGTSFPLAEVEDICRKFNGIVAIDEAYADFAADNAVKLALKFDNVIVLRTFSKSYSLAGLRLGYAIASAPIIEGLMKLKDSYNVDMLTQLIGEAAFLDQQTMLDNCRQVVSERQRLAGELKKIGFTVVPSEANFLFATPPDGDGRRCFEYLRGEAILVRYFAGNVTGKYMRITVGLPQENDRVIAALKKFYQC